MAIPALALAADGVPAELRGAIMAKALNYEKKSQAGSGKLVIGVVGPASGPGASDAKAMERALAQVARRGIAERRASVVRITDVDPGAAASKMKGHGATVAYIASGMGSAGRSLAATLSARRMLVMCGDPNHVGAGCMLSVEPRGGTSQLVVDVGASTQAGYQFDARMLRLARVVR